MAIRTRQKQVDEAAAATIRAEGQQYRTQDVEFPGYGSDGTAQEPSRFDGVGFVFDHYGPYVGIDLDHCLNEAGELLPWAAEIVAEFPTYCEYSVSGEGLHLICKGTLPEALLHGKGTGRRKGPIEVYSHGRFFCTSGVPWESPRGIVDCTPQLANLLAEITAPETKAGRNRRRSRCRRTRATDTARPMNKSSPRPALARTARSFPAFGVATRVITVGMIVPPT